MSKLSLATTVVLSIATLVVGSIYLAKVANTPSRYISETWEEFKKYGNRSCVYHSFPGLDFGKKGETITSESKVDSSAFAQEKKEGSSCLVVNWDKQTSMKDNSSFQGSFRWLWTFVEGNKGFSVFVVAIPTAAEKEWSMSGVFYLMSKDEKTGWWKIDKNKEISPEKKLNSKDFDNVFPTVGEGLKGLYRQPKNDYWGFVNGKDDMDKACKKGEGSACAEDLSFAYFQALWLMRSFGEKGKEVKQWSGNIDTWLSNLFSTSEIDLSGALGDAKGEWKVISFY